MDARQYISSSVMLCMTPLGAVRNPADPVRWSCVGVGGGGGVGDGCGGGEDAAAAAERSGGMKGR
jgi:hypothetical protein